MSFSAATWRFGASGAGAEPPIPVTRGMAQGINSADRARSLKAPVGCVGRVSAAIPTARRTGHLGGSCPGTAGVSRRQGNQAVA